MAGSHPRVLTLSPKELLVLELLREEDSYGLQLVAASTGRLKRGTVYVTLGRMEEKGYITSKLEAAPSGVGGLPRRIYASTPLGRRMFAAWTSGAKQCVVIAVSVLATLGPVRRALRIQPLDALRAE